jgi:ApaG protein
MVTEITAGIKVSVETFFQPDHSDVLQSCYLFAYRITIENDSEFPVKLKKRHWHIIDAYSFRREVEGDGVIGEQPVIKAGERYQYVSGCDMRTEIGRMYGTYLMEKLSDGTLFTVNIPQFSMVAPFKLN